MQRFFGSSGLLRWVGYGLVVIMMLLPFHAFLSTWGGTVIGPLGLWKAWKELLLGSMAPVVLAVLWRQGQLPRIMRDRFVWFGLFYLIFLAAMAVCSLGAVQTPAIAAGVLMDGRYVLAFLLVYVVARYLKIDASPWAQRASCYLVVVGSVLAVIGVIQVTLLPADFLRAFGYSAETISPYVLIDQNPDALRAFATLRGPNDFGAFLILPLLLVVTGRRWLGSWWLPSLVAVLVGLLATASRSAWIGALVALVALAAVSPRGSWLTRKRVAGASVAACVVLVGVAVSAITIPTVRLLIFHSSPGDSSLTEGSTDQHWRATSEGLARVAAHPEGCGPGCAGPASYYGDNPQISENYYVQIAEELGVAGLAIWLGLWGMVMVGLYRRRHEVLARVLWASGIGIGVIGLWLHVWSDDPLSIIWWSLAALVVALSKRVPASPDERSSGRRSSTGTERTVGT